jgi:hypothetical protein
VGEGSALRPGRSLSPGKNRYPLYRRLGGPQCRSGQVRKISTPPGFDPRTVQSVACRYTDYTTGFLGLVFKDIKPRTKTLPLFTEWGPTDRVMSAPGIRSSWRKMYLIRRGKSQHFCPVDYTRSLCTSIQAGLRPFRAQCTIELVDYIWVWSLNDSADRVVNNELWYRIVFVLSSKGHACGVPFLKYSKHLIFLDRIFTYKIYFNIILTPYPRSSKWSVA